MDPWTTLGGLVLVCSRWRRRRRVDRWTLLTARPRRRRVDHWTLLTARPRRRQVDEAVDVAGQVGVAPGPAASVAGGVAHVRAPARLRLQLSVDMGRLRERASHAARGTVGLGEGAARLLGTAPHAQAAAAAAVSVGADDRLLQYLEAAPRTRSSAIAEGPRDAPCQLKSCQLPRNSAETTCTTSPQPSISCR